MQIPLQKIADPVVSSSGVNLYVLRLDMNHPHISGNKFFKLKYNLEEAKRQGKDTLLTFGGAYSNHIAATAAAGKEYGFKTIGVVRGDELAPLPYPSLQKDPAEKSLNPTLRLAKKNGMKLHFVSREEYRALTANNALPENIPAELQIPDTRLYFLPEGGTNALAVKGCSEIPSLITISFDYVCCPVGTGGTIAGIISSLKTAQHAIGFSVLKAPGYHEKEVKKWLPVQPFSNFQFKEEYHFGGYAKYTSGLLSFMDDFEKKNNIPLDRIYTGKMMFGVYDLIHKGYFKSNQTVVVVHTGGLQGRPSCSGRD